MPTITAIKAPAFQSRDINLALSDANVITGDTFSGKTSVIRALLIGMYGYLPPKKENAAVFKYCSHAKELFVRLCFSDDRVNQVTVSRDDDGFSKSEDLQVTFPTVLMDAQEYFALTAQKRLSYVLSRVDVEKCGYKEQQLLDSMLAVPDGESKKAVGHELLLEEWRSTIGKTVKDRRESKAPVKDWMDGLLLLLKEHEKATKSGLKLKKLLLDAEEPTAPREVHASEMQEADKAYKLAVQNEAVGGDSREEQIETIDDEIVTAKRAVQDAHAELDSLDDEDRKMSKLSHCPTCLNDGTQWLKAWRKQQEKRKAPMEKTLSDAKASLKQLEAKLEKLKSKPVNAGTAKLRSAVQAAEKRRNEVREAQSAWEHYKTDCARRETAKAGITYDTMALTLLKHMIDKLVECQSVLAESAFKLLLKTARQFTDGILRGPLEYRAGELGYTRDTTWVSHECFSGTEELIAYAGLQIALCQSAPVRIVVMDELGRMTSDKKQQVTQRMLELMRSHVIDQWIGVDVTRDWLSGSLRSRVNVIEVK